MLAPLVALVLLVDVVFAAFSDAMARKQMIFMSAAAYSDEPQTCFENLAMDVTVRASLVKMRRTIFLFRTLSQPL